MSTTQTDAGLRVALEYYHAWTGGDFEHAMTYIAPDIHCSAPSGPMVGAEAFRGFMGPFATQELTSAKLLTAFGEGDTALLMYDTTTVSVPHAPAAELHTVSDGKIVSLRIIFDQLPFERAHRDDPPE